MAARLDGWNGTRTSGVEAERAQENGPLSREARLARLQRRRRLTRAQAALEGAAWVAGAAAVTILAFAGLFGLR